MEQRICKVCVCVMRYTYFREDAQNRPFGISLFASIETMRSDPKSVAGSAAAIPGELVRARCGGLQSRRSDGAAGLQAME